MTQMIPLIGGPKNGETVAVPDTINFESLSFPQWLAQDSELYIICQSGDGYFYGVYNPRDYDPSIARRNALRNAIRGVING